jgi:hypothetical protein
MPNPFFECNEFKFQTVASQPEAFIAEFSAADLAKLAVVCEAIANAFAENTPQVRSRLVREAKLHDLFAIFVDWPRAAGSKTILLARRDGNRILVARGLESVDGRIAPGEIERAEQVLARPRGDDGEEGGRG